MTCTILRIILFRRLSSMCSVPGMELKYDLISSEIERASKTDKLQIFLPFLLSLFELATKQNRIRLTSRSQILPTSACSYSLRYVLLVGVWALSAFGTVSLSTQRLIYICPLTNGRANIIYIFQCLELFLDASIIIAISKMLKDVQGSGNPWRSLGQSALASAGVVGILACLFLLKNPEHTSWALRLDHKVVVDLFFVSLLCTNFIGSVVYLMNELRLGTIFTTASCISVYVHHFSALQHQITVPSASRHGQFVGLSLITFASMIGLARIEREASRSQQYLSLNQNSSRTLMSLCIFMFMTTTFFGTKPVLYSSKNKWAIHPIDVLISNARSTSDQWLEQAAASRSLEELVVEYQSRYGIPPPPHFDKWYDFATSRGSLIMNDFAQVHNDLLPFWGIKPATIRQMTRHMLVRPWTEVAEMRISNGTAHPGPDVPPTHL